MNGVKNITIKDWSSLDKPREKFIDKGARSLSDSELIAILIGSGSSKLTAVDLTKLILSDVNNSLVSLGKLSLEDLLNYNGIGESKAITILAAIELAKRYRVSDANIETKISSSKSLYELMLPFLGGLNHEEFWVVYLNTANKVLAKEQISKGGISFTSVDNRIILKRALNLNSVSIIAIHNHPSGNLKPSSTDINLTNKLKLACDSLEIKLLDHIIISDTGYYSFLDENIL